MFIKYKVMKKLLIVLAFASLSTASFAQDELTEKYSVATNSFWSNWFIQGGVNWNAWYSSFEHGMDLDKAPWEKFRSNPGVSVALGKWFTPGMGLRLKAQGIWGKQVYDDNNDGNGNKYWVLNGHAMFNLTNMLLGYSETRVVNIIPFIGGGIGRTMTYDMYAMDLSAGVQAQFRLNKKFAVHAELGWNRFEGDIDGGLYGWGNRGWDSHDNNLYAELGVTFNLGKATWDKTPDVDAINAQHQAALDALNAKLRDAQNENDRLRNMLANQKPAEPAKAVKDLIATPVSVFFNLDKTNIASQKDLVNVRALAKFAKDEDRNLLVTGYADSATGTPEHNQWLSERRAEPVANEIVKMGVDESRITTVGKGGVDILSPVSFNRRATVQVTE